MQVHGFAERAVPAGIPGQPELAQVLESFAGALPDVDVWPAIEVMAVTDGSPASSLELLAAPDPADADGRTLRPLGRVALDHWPRLDRAALARAKGDPLKIARLVTRRTALPVTAVLAILVSRPR
jgi:hypothetical protein